MKDHIATIKLISGEELISQVEKQSNPLHIKLINPVLVHKTNTALGPVLSVSHWLMFTEENEIVLERKNIVALKFGIEDNTIQHYLNFTREKGEIINFRESSKLEDLVRQLGEKALGHREEYDEFLDEQKDVANTTIH